MICKHCYKPITGGSYTVRGKYYHDECYHELFKNDGESRVIALCPHELPMPCLLCQVKELETQNAIYHDLKDVSLTKDLERIAELEAAISEHEKDLISRKPLDFDSADQNLWRVLE